MVYGGVKHESVLGHEELRAKSFAVFSFGKTYHATGWKLAYCVAPEVLTTEFRKIHQWVFYAVVTPIQLAIAEYMQRTPEHYAALPVFYEKKRDHFCELLKDSGFSFRPAKGTFFQILDYSAIADEDDVTYASKLTREIGVASIPVSVFCEKKSDDRLLRFCFAKDDDMLEQAAAKLCQL